MNVSLKKLWPWWLLMFSNSFAIWTNYIGEYDPMRVVQCDTKCNQYSSIHECMEICLAANYTKLGFCPEENSMSPFEAACLIACNSDSQCSDVAKCCTNNCGITCMHPIGLDEHNDLPEIPDGIEIRREKSNMITISWNIRKVIRHQKLMKNNWVEYNEHIRYLVEERYVLGPRYLESRLSSWSVRQVTNKNHISIRVGIKSGHWYQFRVAAVNEIGSRGYSTPSIPFKTAEPKNPREPRSLSLSGARIHADGKLGIVIRWRQPSSDVPIVFYKLFWSRLIHGPTNDSILVYHRSVPKDQNCFEIRNLDIGCQYFLQVQAVSIYGGRRLASRKASKVFNSTDYIKYGRNRDKTDIDKRAGTCGKHGGGLRVRRFVCQCGETIEARVVWPVDPHAVGYNVSWREDTCLHNSKNTKGVQNFIAISTMSQLTQNTRLDIKQLNRDCTYSVNVRSINKEYENELKINHNWLPGERSLGIEFVTYGCQRYRSHDSNDSLREFDVLRCKKRKARIKRLNKSFLFQTK